MNFQILCLFVLQFYGPVNPMGSCRARSVPNHTFTGQAWSSKRLTSIVHILSPETDNCPSWISRRERMTVENISWLISSKECCRPRRGSNPRPSGVQSDAHPTEPPKPVWTFKCPLIDILRLYKIDCYFNRDSADTIMVIWCSWNGMANALPSLRLHVSSLSLSLSLSFSLSLSLYLFDLYSFYFFVFLLLFFVTFYYTNISIGLLGWHGSKLLLTH